jgi:DNA-binding CsgD family transcriptional regulator
MAKTENPPPTAPPAPKRQRQPSAAARWIKQAREMRVLDALKSGASISAIARQEGVSTRRVRDIVNALLASRPDLEPADGLTQIRSHRLDQALEAAFGEVRSGSRAAIGQLMRVLHEFDRNAEIDGQRKPK